MALHAASKPGMTLVLPIPSSILTNPGDIILHTGASQLEWGAHHEHTRP